MSNALAIPEGPRDGYALAGGAGIWDKIPEPIAEGLDAMATLGKMELTEGETEPVLNEEQQQALTTYMEFRETPPYPYLQLWYNQGPPTKDKPAYLYMAALTTDPLEPFAPADEQAAGDALHIIVEMNRVLVEDTPVEPDRIVYDPAQENNPAAPTKTVTALLYKGVKPIGFHPPVIQALQRFVASTGVAWDPASLADIAGMDQEFYHFETVVPDVEVVLTLDGEAHTTTASALVAAGLRTAICETVRMFRAVPMAQALEEDPELLVQFQQAVAKGSPTPFSAAVEAISQQPKQLEQ